MSQVWTIIWHEVSIMLRKPSYWLGTLLLPAMVVGITLLSQGFASDLEAQGGLSSTSSAAEIESIGYVDLSGLITFMPDTVPSDLLRPYRDEASAQEDLQSGLIGCYVLLPADYLEAGELVLVSDISEAPAITGLGPVQRIIEMVINANLMGDPERASALALLRGSNRLIGRALRLAPEPEPSQAPEPAAPQNSMVGYLAGFIIFFILASGGGYLLQSVTAEKENRTVEILLTSIQPQELMLGKIIGLGFISLLQVLIWLGVSSVILSPGARILGTVVQVEISPVLAVCLILYVLLGYLAYAAVLAAIGALAPNLRESAQIQGIVLLPAMAPIFFSQAFVEQPHGALATALSLFPPSAPAAMSMRLMTGGVPIWQVLLSLALLAGTAWLLILLAGRIFHPAALLSTARLDWKRWGEELRTAVRGGIP